MEFTAQDTNAEMRVCARGHAFVCASDGANVRENLHGNFLLIGHVHRHRHELENKRKWSQLECTTNLTFKIAPKHIRSQSMTDAHTLVCVAREEMNAGSNRV